MHAYSTDNDFRPKFLAYLGVSVYLVTTGINSYFIPALWDYLQLPTEISIAVTFGILFTVFYTLFEKWLWKYSWIPSRISSVPNLNGHWEGHIKVTPEKDIDEQYVSEDGDSTDGGYTTMDATLDIEQTWRRINVHFETGRSPSDSTGASFKMEHTHYPMISYQFENHGPSPDEMEEDEGPYDGTAQLKYKPQSDGDVLEGYYYTGPSRNNNYGNAYFTRVNE